MRKDKGNKQLDFSEDSDISEDPDDIGGSGYFGKNINLHQPYQQQQQQQHNFMHFNDVYDNKQPAFMGQMSNLIFNDSNTPVFSANNIDFTKSIERYSDKPQMKKDLANTPVGESIPNIKINSSSNGLSCNAPCNASCNAPYSNSNSITIPSNTCMYPAYNNSTVTNNYGNSYSYSYGNGNNIGNGCHYNIGNDNESRQISQILQQSRSVPSNYNRATTNILMSMANQNVFDPEQMNRREFVNRNFRVEQMTNLNEITEIKMEEDKDYEAFDTTLQDNVQALKEAKSSIDSTDFSPDTINGLQGNLAETLAKDTSLKSILEKNTNEMVIDSLRSRSLYEVTSDNIKDVELSLCFINNNNIAAYIENLVNILITGDDPIQDPYKAVLLWFVNIAKLKFNVIDAPPKVQFDFNPYDLYGILNRITIDIIGRKDPKTLTKEEAEKVAVKVIETINQYIDTQIVLKERNQKITDFDEVMNVLKQVASHYVRVSPTLKVAVQTVKDMFNINELNVQGSKEVKNLFNKAFNSLNSVINQSHVTRENFNVAMNNFSNFYTEYVNLTTQTEMNNLNIQNNFVAINNDISQIKMLFSILTGDKSGDIDNIIGGVSNLFKSYKEVFQNKGFTDTQISYLSQIIEMVKDKNKKDIMMNNNQIIKFLRKCNDQITDIINSNTKEMKAEMDAIKTNNSKIRTELDKINSFLIKAIEENDGNSLLEILQSMDKRIDTNKKMIDSTKAALDIVEGDITDIKTDVTSLNVRMKDIESMSNNMITQEQYKEIVRRQNKLEKDLDDIREINKAFKEYNEDMGIYNAMIDSDFDNAMNMIKKVRNDIVKENATGITKNSRSKRLLEPPAEFVSHYRQFLPDSSLVMNNIAIDIDDGISVAEYINKAIANIDSISKNDEYAKSVEVSTEIIDKMIKISYLLQIVNEVFEYKNAKDNNPIFSSKDTDIIKKIVRIMSNNIKIIINKNIKNDNMKVDNLDNMLDVLKMILNKAKVNDMTLIRTKDNKKTVGETYQEAWSSLVLFCKANNEIPSESTVEVHIGKMKYNVNMTKLIEQLVLSVTMINNEELTDALSDLLNDFDPKKIGDFIDSIRRAKHNAFNESKDIKKMILGSDVIKQFMKDRKSKANAQDISSRFIVKK